MTDRDLFLHEYIDINGMHQWDYMEHAAAVGRREDRVRIARHLVHDGERSRPDARRS